MLLSPISSPSIGQPQNEVQSSPSQSNHPNSSPIEDVEEKRFISSLFGFMANRGTPIEKIPIFDHKELNLFKLYSCVISRGGLEAVIENKLWRQITTDLAVDPERTDAGFRLRIHYLKYLYPYERKYYLNRDDDERFDYEAFEKHLSKSPSDKKQQILANGVARVTKKKVYVSSPSPNSGKNTPSPSSSPNSLVNGAMSSNNSNTTSMVQHNNVNSFPHNSIASGSGIREYSSSPTISSINSTPTFDSVNNNNIQQQHHLYQSNNNNNVNNNNYNNNNVYNSQSNSFFNENLLSSSIHQHNISVNLKMLEIKSLKKYNQVHRLKVSSSPSRTELVKAVIQHFDQQKIDEESIISQFLKRVRSENRIRVVEKV